MLGSSIWSGPLRNLFTLTEVQKTGSTSVICCENEIGQKTKREEDIVQVCTEEDGSFCEES